MATQVNDALAFALADVLEAQIEFAGGKLRAEITRTVDIAGIPFTVTGKIASQWLNKNSHLVLVRLTGNLVLGICAVADSKHKTIVHLWVCNLAKMRNPDGWLEFERPSNAMEMGKLLGDAAVKKFIRNGASGWAAV